MAGIFISYRRDDQPGFVGRLSDALIAAYGSENVFRDVDDIHPGDDFVAELTHQLHNVDAMLVVIGPNWLAADDNGSRRIDSPDDFVRQEIRTALAARYRILPILVAGAEVPDEPELPDDIRALARHQAMALSDLTWASDIARLLHVLNNRLLKHRKPLAQLFVKRWRIAAGLLFLLAGLAIVADLASNKQTPPLSASLTANPAKALDQSDLQAAEALSGRWTAQVTYDWGAQYAETFIFEVDNGAIHGTASYLQVARTIENAQVRSKQLTFTTHSQEALGSDPHRTVTHLYRGTVEADELRLTLETRGSYGQHPPIELFVVRASGL